MRKLIPTSFAVALLPLFAGCCVSYHAVAKIKSMDSADQSNLVALVGTAVKSVGETEIAKRSIDGKETVYTVHRGAEVVEVGIDDQTPAIYMGWNWRNHSLPLQLQSAIARDYDAVYHATLTFERLPCGWFGP